MNELITIKQPENWIHYSSSDAQILVATRNQADRKHMFFKPRGLWITPEYAEQNWYDWCTEEEFQIQNLKYIHDVKFKAGAKLLRLETDEDILAFSEKYGYDLTSTLPNWLQRNYLGSTTDSIYWEKVASEYQGILIPRYSWECRMDMRTFWYYAWDCASGCIWDADAIESITAREMARAD